MALGAVRAATVTDAIAASDVVIICVIDYDAVREIVDRAVPELRGRLLVNLTSGAPDSARTMAGWAAEHGIDYLDGSIMTRPTRSARRPR